ncbi:chromatin accessibility complex protein 1 [Ochlerotatus camptorhynchus]|uniref:chromatin accessibility complex protein 1 n=1 Tax=Ochlerotatus camptorhynchus TaxID=644619 RepID=UPI0031DDC93E
MDQEKLTQLPISRIRTVMKTSPSIGHINQDALFLMCRAAEMFVEYIAKNAHKKGTTTMNYKQLAEYVESKDALDFLVQILPKKMTVSQYKKIMENKKSKGEDDSDSDEDSSSEEESDDSEPSSSSEEEGEEEKNDDVDSVISIKSSSSDEKENSKNMSNKKTPVKHKTGDSP